MQQPFDGSFDTFKVFSSLIFYKSAKPELREIELLGFVSAKL